MKIKRLSDNRRLELLPLLALLIMFAVILYAETAQRHPKIYFPPEESVPWQIFRIECIERYCPALDFLFSSEFLQNIKFTDWCTRYVTLYDPSKCNTSDKCYVQEIGESCDGKDKFSPEFPEKVKVNCSFHLTTGELCNPDAIKDGWIKCCKEPSLENCNCE